MNRDVPPHRLLIEPNCALTPRGALYFYAWMCVASLGIALLFTSQGFWPVLPFAGLEMVVLGVALWLSMRRGSYRERISIFRDRIVVEKGQSNRRERAVFPLHWAHVNLLAARGKSHTSRLIIRSHGRSCEIGSCLTETEKESLARRLAELIGRADQTPERWLAPDSRHTGHAHR